MSAEDGDRSVRGYRAATGALDERPSAAARAAILAAAARQVQAGPRDARESLAAPRVASRRRWPYAAAAAVLLSSLAVMMATRTEREMPTFTAPAERVAENAASLKPVPSSEPPAPAVSSTASPEAASTPAAVPAKSGKQAKASVSRADVTGEAKIAPPAEAPRAKEEVAALRDTPPPVVASAPPTGADAAPSAALPAQLAKRQAAPPSDAEGRRRNESADAASAERPALRQAPAAPPAAGLGAATGAVGAEADASTAPSASEWLERIIKLRRAGRHDEADVELKRFRENYPQVTVPAEALPATGTR
jgi:ribonuclease E